MPNLTHKQAREIELLLLEAPDSGIHYGPVAHGWTTPEPDTCPTCRIMEIVRYGKTPRASR